MGMMRRKWKVMGSECTEGTVCVCVLNGRGVCGAVSHRFPFKEYEPPAESDRARRERREEERNLSLLPNIIFYVNGKNIFEAYISN